MANTPRPFFSSTPVDPQIACRDAGLDDTIESSFPASDPPSSIPDPSYASSADDAEDALAPVLRRAVQAIEEQIAKVPAPILWAAAGAAGAVVLIGVYNTLRSRRPDPYYP
jgi:hypothetical protein